MRDDLAKSLHVADPFNRLDFRRQPEPAASAGRWRISWRLSDFTRVARRPGVTWSWTENWPYEPLVGNTPTANIFRWTWISFGFTFFAFGVVLFIYEFFLENPLTMRLWTRCWRPSGR